jgi:hypothetical protein
MKIFLAGNGHKDDVFINRKFYNFYRLESYLHIGKKEPFIINEYKDFILDSGAFTYLSSASGNVDWEQYVDNYADFIIKYKVKNFIELDIDSIVGIKEVERLRAKLEAKVGRQSIPVWHKSRGKQYWLDMVKEYDYVAIGGIVTREIKPSEYKYFHWLLAEAKKQNCKVHGLGFTNLKGLDEYDFYSVDSTSWLSGNRFGSIYKFNGRTMLKFDKPAGMRVKTTETARNNFYEWVKFANYKEGV